MAQKLVPRNVNFQLFLHRDCGAAKFVHHAAVEGPDNQTTGRHYHTLVSPFLLYKNMLVDIPGVEDAASIIQERYIERLLREAKGRQTTEESISIVNACMDARFNGFLDSMTDATIHRTLGGYLKPLRTKLELMFGAKNINRKYRVLSKEELDSREDTDDKFLAICSPLVINHMKFDMLARAAGTPTKDTYFITLGDDKTSARILFDTDFMIASLPFFNMKGYVLFEDKRNPEPAKEFRRLLEMKRDQFQLKNLLEEEHKMTKHGAIEY